MLSGLLRGMSMESPRHANVRIEPLEARRLLSAGALDTTFSTDGKITSAFGSDSADGFAVAVQSDGKVLVAGYAANANDGTDDFAVARFNSDGTFDSSFGKNGVTIFSPGRSLFNQALSESAAAIAVGPGGKIVVGGTAFDYNFGGGTAYIWELARLNPNGSPDSSFGSNGYSYATFNNHAAILNALAVRSDGSIVAAGTNQSFGVVGVIGSNGFFSGSFNSIGYWVSSVDNSRFNSIAVQTDGKIVVAGSVVKGSRVEFTLSRLNAGGALDPNFGVDGTVTTDPGPLVGLADDAALTCMALAGNGDVIAGGTLGKSNGWVIARYRSTDGSLSNTFGFSGVTTASFGGDADLRGLAVQRDGKIVLAGDYATSAGADPTAAIGRISSAGFFDPTFAGVGYETGGFAARSNFAAVALQSDGKALAVGIQLVDMILARFQGDPQPVKSIAGSVVNDANANGVLDAGEKGVAGRTIYLDANKNGKVDAGEKTTTTAGDGSYAFTALAAGTYVVREMLPTSWRRTGPSAGSFTITLTKGQTVSGKNFLETQDVIIAGALYNDANGNAKRDSTEKGISGRTIFIDKNKNGKLDAGEPKTTTAADGTYSFKTLPPGTYRLAEVVPTGSRISSPAVGYYDLTLTGAQTASGKDFGNTQLALISGTVFFDTNFDGRIDAADKPLAGWVVFLDANNNSRLDAGEKSFTTGSDGKFNFVVAASKYNLRIVIKKGFYVQLGTPGLYSLTLGSGQMAAGKIFLIGQLV